MNVIVILLAALGVALLLFVSCLLGTAFGALGGWVVGLVFTDTMKLLATMLGQPAMQPWEMGAILGFVGAFFRTSVTAK